MATSPSNPYKSRFLRGVLRQARHWLDRGQTTFRQAQVVASWSVQILLYPIYAAFQTGRWVGNVIERSQDTAQLRELTPERTDIPLTSEAEELTAETPLQNVLQTIQTLELPANYAVIAIEPVAIRAIASQLETRSLVLVTNYNQIIALPDSQVQHWLKQRIIYEIALYNRAQRSRRLPGQRLLRLVHSIRHTIQRFRHTQPATAFLAPGASYLPLALDLSLDRPIKQSLLAVKTYLTADDFALAKSLPANLAIAVSSSPSFVASSQVKIRGVVSLLGSGNLALVSHANEILDILTVDQQAWLQQRITWEIAHYNRYLELRQQTIALPPLRPPARGSILLPPVQAFQWMIAWMQSGVVARSTNLFQEADWIACPLPNVEMPPAAIVATVAPTVALTPTSTSTVTIQGKSYLQQNKQSGKPVASQTSNFATCNLDALTEFGDLAETQSLTPSTYVETCVTLVEYEQSWLERVMRWLDHCFAWIETTFNQVWQRVTGDRTR